MDIQPTNNEVISNINTSNNSSAAVQPPPPTLTAPPAAPAAPLCASCDRCRSRKTKCDGKRPCSNCATKYMKKYKVSSIQNVEDYSLFECVYSPAKRRGPVPGKSGRKAEGNHHHNNNYYHDNGWGSDPYDTTAVTSMNMPGLNMYGGITGTNNNNNINNINNINNNFQSNNNNSSSNNNGDLEAMQRQLLLQQQQLMLQTMGTTTSSSDNPMALNIMQQQMQLQQQQQQVLNNMRLQQHQQHMQGPSQNNNIYNNNNINGTTVNGNDGTMNPAAKMMRPTTITTSSTDTTTSTTVNHNVRKHLPLLEKSSSDGNRLRSYYSLSIDALFKFPPIPTDEEYCTKLNNITINPMTLPPYDQAALRAARFAEIALGAMVTNQIALSLELSNATISCLKQCVQDPSHPQCMYEIARAYFLYGLFRSYRADMSRYFKYRRVCLSKLSQLDSQTMGIEALLAAISFHDSWAYMIYNANEESLPNIDETIPPVSQSNDEYTTELITAAENKYKTSTDPSKIASDAKNQMWIQGPPPVFINNEAPPLSRSLDALACAIRSCCDQANTSFSEYNNDGSGCGMMSQTSQAVMANNAELCSRNMVLSAFTLLQQSESSKIQMEKNHSHHLLISAMDAFLEGGDEEEAGGFTDSQIQSLLSVSNAVIDRPLLLFQAGPTYHMISNTAVQLSHLLNGLHSNRMQELASGEAPGEMESALFDEVLDTYIALRKILEMHRRKLPLLLRCHKLPRPNMMKSNEPGVPFIDLAETHMCASRGCQGFVLMACSPCVAAERAAAADLRHKEEIAAYGEGGVKREETDGGNVDVDVDYGIDQLRSELDMEDDALISILGQILNGE